ncbi:unnamed protein product [Durusdinium trenchii]|uniref:SWIM-type domain-containing protein n=2 Tax=Durusdinium trenchii TaxID=1381693 RepID=A0ABP0RMW6_9DINO
MKEASPGFCEADIERACNPGSFQKGLTLMKQGAVKLTGGSAGAEAQVASERGHGHYAVRLGRCGVSVNAKCSCVDARTRGGLCKHAAAVALVFLQHSQDLPQMPLVSNGASSKRPRPPATPRLESPEPEEVKEPVPLKKPCFPKATPRAPSGYMARGFFLRQLQSSAMAGDHEAFANDLERMDELGEKEASALLHKAVQGQDLAGSERIIQLLLDRPDGQRVAMTGAFDELRRTPLHAAVAANRLGICRSLLQARADVAMKNGNGMTSLDLAQRRKVDTSKGDWRQHEDPVLVLLREAMKRRTT